MAEAQAFLEKRIASRRRPSLAPALFGPQRAFFEDPANFADAVCSRRAGKSVGVSAWLLEGPIGNPKAPSLYLTLTRGSAKRNIWGLLLDFNRTHGLGYEPNEAELALKREGRAVVYLAGLDNKSEIEKARGTGWGRVAIDEAQALPSYIKELVEDVLMPALADHDGKIRMIGTPPPVPVGYFHDMSHSAAWSHHAWTVWENPHVPGARKMLDRVLQVRGVTEADPSIQREWFGRWMYDPSALVFRFDPAKNTYTELPEFRDWSHVIGVDLGWEDADAIAVLAFHEKSPDVYLVEEQINRKETISQLAARLTRAVQTYNPQALVLDTGGLGKKIAEELASRFSLPIAAAEKSRKLEFIALLNDALRTGHFHAKTDSRFAHDAMLVEWNRDKSTNDRQVVSDRYHSDIGDAVLYAYRESMHWLHVPEKQPGPALGSAEWARAEADRMHQAELDEMEQGKRHLGVQPEGLGDSEQWETWARQ